MADMLKFRKGTLAQINGATKAAGTVYIATDEKAMYVDINANDRIRIGDLIRVSSINKIEPPFSTTSLYYVEDQNALLGYDGSEWKQINGTEAIVSRIATAEGLIAANTKAIGDNAKAIDDVEAYVGTFSHATAKTVVEYINAKTDGIATSGNLEALGNRVTVVEGRVITAESDIDALEGTVAGHTTKLSALETASAKHALKTDLDAYAKSADVYTKTQVYTKDEVDAAIDADVLVETNRAKAAELALENAAKAAQQTANAAVTKESFAEFQESNTEAIAAAAESATTAANTYTDGKITAEVTRADGAYAPKSLVETVNGHASKINTLTGSGDGSVAQAKARADEAYALADAAVTADELSDAIANFATKTDVANAKTAVLGEANYDGTVKGAYEAAAAAKKAADDANDLAAEKTTAAEVKTQIEAYKYATETKAAELATAAKNEAIEDAKKYALQTSLDATNGIVSGHTTKLDTLTGSGAGSVAEAKKAGDDAAAALETYKTAHANDYTNTQIDTAIADAKKAGTDAQTTANTANNQANANKAAIEKLNGDVNTDGSVAKAVADAKAALSAEIDADIRAANALEYAGTVSSTKPLPTTGVKNGAVYVVEEATDTYFPGDLIIAQGTEDPDTGLIPAGSVEWKRVKTGYDATLEQSISTDGNAIKLSSLAGRDNGAISFVADDSAATVTVANNTVTVGMAWEDFPAEA